MKFLSYHPQSSIKYYVQQFATDIFDKYDLYDEYDIDFFISTSLNFTKERIYIHGLNKSIAAACIYAVSGNWMNIEKKEGIPHLQQKQIAKITNVSCSTINRILKEIRQPRYPNYSINLKKGE